MKGKWVAFLGLLLVTGWLLAGVQPVRAEGELIVSAAASLTNAFTDLGKNYQQTKPGVKVLFNFAASGYLMQQIAMGAPADVFASADQKTMNQAQEKKLILPASRKNFVNNGLVLIVPRGSKLSIKSLDDLSKPEVKRISLGNPASVPVGRYAREALKNEGLWEKLQPKFIFGDSVRQVLDYVSRGEVDAGLVFSTDAMIAKDKVEPVVKVEKHQPIVYPLAIVATSGKKAQAQKFIDFVLSPEGQKILGQYGFEKP
jgi:molybdate transport system substrate-binding protein